MSISDFYCLFPEGRLIVEVEAEGPPGKVFALQWLTAGRILALGAAGVMTTWEIQDEGRGGEDDWLCSILRS